MSFDERDLKMMRMRQLMSKDYREELQKQTMELVIQTQLRMRMVELEKRATEEVITGDFRGSVTGTWLTLGRYGEGIVKYKDKEYITVPIGFVSIPRNSPVELTFANGIYYSKF